MHLTYIHLQLPLKTSLKARAKKESWRTQGIGADITIKEKTKNFSHIQCGTGTLCLLNSRAVVQLRTGNRVAFVA